MYLSLGSHILSRSMEANILKSKKDIYLVQKYGGRYFAKVKRIDILSGSMEANMFDKRIGVYFIYIKLSGGSFPHITTKEYNMILNAVNVINSIYDKYKPNDRTSFLTYSFVLKKLLIMLGKVEYAKYIPQLKTHSKQKELEREWELITKDREWVVALRKQKIA